ncbi:MAG: hypothetical protein COA79_16115 [Planctomycetota bacterium]|nr:MAG: hypothetical protein COA79_16115 [Planctomycetota bacterium]
MSEKFKYDEATARNIGLVSTEEQRKLKDCTIAIAGLGAVGGNYLLTLSRMGVENFKIADLDVFDMVNLQRQAGAFISKVGQTKVDVMAEMALDINPNINITRFTNGIQPDNIDDFLDGVDIALDGIDAFQIGPRRLLYNNAEKKGVFVVCSSPIGYTSSLFVFDPNGMKFDKYFSIDDSMTRAEQIASFLIGLTPSLTKKSVIDSNYVDFSKEKGPCLASTIAMCTGLVSCEVLRIILKRNPPMCAPRSIYVDPYERGMIYKKRRPFRFKFIQKFLLGKAFQLYPSLNDLHIAELEKQKTVTV